MCEERLQQRRPQAQPARMEVNRRGFLRDSALAATGAALGAVPLLDTSAGKAAAAGPGEDPKGGDPGAARAVHLNGLTLSLSPPRVVAETSVGHCWYPDLLKFSSGGLMLTYSL